MFAESFIARWSQAEASERANAQQFLIELADLLDVPRPSNTHSDGYSFEFPVRIPRGDGTSTEGRIDLYRRASFVLEAKQFAGPKEEQTPLSIVAEEAGIFSTKKKSGPVRGSDAWDDAMFKARGQAERYARSLPTDEPNPPFLLVVDVGHSFEIFADFTQAGKSYLPFPDPRGFRIRLADLAEEAVRDRLRRIWLDPLSLDPAKVSAAVTREIAGYLAVLASSLEESGHTPRLVAEFLTRCLFCMFAEDVGLLPKDGFRGLLESLRQSPEGFVPKLKTLFAEMQTGTDFSVILNKKLLRFNGGVFEDASVLPLDGTQLGVLIKASQMQWKNVEPAIFGTLLERALDPEERHSLGAHYTPRAYVERLVLPTIVEPLRSEWDAVRTAALVHAKAGRLDEARDEIRGFHDQLCKVTVLDPACGSGNFLYVTLEHLKRLEGEVLDVATGFGENMLLDLATHTVDPHQFLGIELNPRAASLAELVLWIGYLQWHFRTRGDSMPAEPVLKKFRNIECRDAVLAWDGEPQAVKDDSGNATTVWDRKSQKTDLVTGRKIPDETKRVPLLTYPNARPAEWPKADFIAGNPPFLGKLKVRQDLGDGYAETLRKAYPEIPESADFVMYWWHKAAALVGRGQSKRFGLITTNSLRQTFNRRVVEAHLSGSAGFQPALSGIPAGEIEAKQEKTVRQDAKRSRQDARAPVSLLFAIPDHPWVDSKEGAAVRIAMTVGAKGAETGKLFSVDQEEGKADGSSDVSFALSTGRISADLTVGADVSSTVPLKSNQGLTSMGVMLAGRGFVIEPDEAKALRLAKPTAVGSVLRPLRNGKDLLDESRDVWVIDFTGISVEEARAVHPSLFQIVLTRVKPERDANRDAQFRSKWWLFGRWRQELRDMTRGLPRYIATVETAKHRIFQFMDATELPEHKLVVVGSGDAFHLGVLSSRIHILFALSRGALLEDRPVYPKTECFDPFPFPACDEAQKSRIRALAEELDAHRKRVQAAHPGLTLTGIYNVLEALRAGRELTPKEQAIHDNGLVSVLRQLHDEIDAAVADAYGWSDLWHHLAEAEKGSIHNFKTGQSEQISGTPDAIDTALAEFQRAFDIEILRRLVALNAERAAEEAAGKIRWLRPEYQNPTGTTTQGGLQITTKYPGPKSKAQTPKSAKLAWPKSLAERVRAIEQALSADPATPSDLAKRFSRAKESDIAEILETLSTFGRLTKNGAQFSK